jgi:hypothetical protein
MKIEIKHKLNIITLVFCLLPVWTWAASYQVSTSTSIVDGDTFCGGGACTSSDTIIIAGGARGSLTFRNFDGNGSYIPIMNEATNRVVITHNARVGWGVLSFYNCKYIDFRGDNNASFTYGIKVINDGSPNTTAGTVWVYGESDHVKLGYIEVAYITGASGTTSSGFMVQDTTLTNSWIFRTFEIHHNYIHDTRYAAMYLGHNAPHSENDPYVAGFSIHDNVMEDLGAYGITYKGVKGPNNYIYNNKIKTTGLVLPSGDVAKQGIGLQYFYQNYYAEIYNNRIEKTVGAGVKVGEADHLIHDNLILGCGTGNSSLWGHAIALFKSDTIPNRADHTVQIYQNTMVESTQYGIKSNDYAIGYHYRNIIAESGIGEAFSFGTITEGAGTNANIYEEDADDVGFKVWIDDGDYSNDDFSLIKVPAPSMLHIVK